MYENSVGPFFEEGHSLRLFADDCRMSAWQVPRDTREYNILM